MSSAHTAHGNTETDVLSVAAAARQRRSIREYEQAPIPHEDLEEILDVARLAPSAFNAQPWRFVVVETPEMKERLLAVANNQRQVRSAPAVIVLYTDMADTLDSLDQIMHPGMDADARARLKAGVLKNFGSQTEAEREAWAAGQGNIALGFLLLAAEARGYQTSPMAGFNAEGVKSLLGLPAHVRVPALVAIGRGSEGGIEHHRHDLQRILKFA